MTSGWEIRAGGPNDLADLERHWRWLHAHHGEVSTASVAFIPADERWSARRNEFERSLEERSAIFLVAEADGEVVGVAFATLRPPDPVFAGGPVGELDTLVVARDRRGEGIGEALARRSFAALRERGAQTVKVVVVAGNEGALRLYRRIGIEPALIELMAPL